MREVEAPRALRAHQRRRERGVREGLAEARARAHAARRERAGDAHERQLRRLRPAAAPVAEERHIGAGRAQRECLVAREELRALR